ncbi:uncharacterized protein LOC112456716 isoform X2 [Temnothorax curvispinosus]|uniref:Uncharacterized protein LOC112452928 isoform X2 n=1 Tax=Temnothorax curvispinosus TaxID=300111 RepID=A0A6J1PHX5_9HYME|nr:uncharacterized protein LOC112452928 isoform X2 [Temnothorax curvispinosus]XP_024875212.1 uncharacterized protein LOC112456716 isoform X2 [Temnothorax curvispinosus]
MRSFLFTTMCTYRKRQMPKLNDRHIFPNLIPKMKVKYATQVISHTVANFINIVLTWNKGIVNTVKGEMCLPASAAITADIILFFDKLFDSFNKKENKELSCIISPVSKHISFWQNAVNRIRQMDFVENTTHKHIRHNAKCLTNWIWTIKGAQYVWNILQKCGFSSFNLRYLNQDLVENCFSQIRDHGHRNNNPTSYQFCASFKTLVTTNLTSKHSISSNCKENDEGTSLSLSKMISTAASCENDEKEEETECTDSSIPSATNCYIFVDTDKIIKNIITNKTVMQCAECVQWLKNEDILRTIEHAFQVAELKFVNFFYETEIKKKLKSILYLEVFTRISTHCSTLLDYLIEETAQEFIVQWCKFINKILNGTQQENYENNYIYNEAKRMSMRFTKKKNLKQTK